MAARLNLTKANITVAGETFTKVDLYSDGVSARIRSRAGGGDLVVKDGVSAVERPGKTAWVVKFADGTEWQVSRDCGCR